MIRKLFLLILSSFVLTGSCVDVFAAFCSQSAPNILGISLGMKQSAAERRLKEIAVLSRNEEKRQQVWLLKNDRRFDYLFVGYDAKNKVRYVTALATGKNAAAERVLYSSVGDIAKARAEISPVSRKYVWQIKDKKNKPVYEIIVAGRDEKYLLCTL
jgi:hypothetical protein